MSLWHMLWILYSDYTMLMIKDIVACAYYHDMKMSRWHRCQREKTSSKNTFFFYFCKFSGKKICLAPVPARLPTPYKVMAPMPARLEQPYKVMAPVSSRLEQPYKVMAPVPARLEQPYKVMRT